MAKAFEVIPRQLCDNAGFDATNILDLFLNYVHIFPFVITRVKSFIGTEHKLLMQTYSMRPRDRMEKLKIDEIEPNIFAVATMLSNK